MAYASVDDVELYVPDLAEADHGKVLALLEQAEAEILVEAPDLDARVADGRTNLILLLRVEAEMVASVMRNPNARQSESQTVGGLSSSQTINVAVASGLLKLTDAHRALIGVAVTRPTTAGAYTVSLWG